jgi:hypothetical protein
VKINQPEAAILTVIEEVMIKHKIKVRSTSAKNLRQN